MAAVTPSTGAGRLLGYALNALTPTDQTLRLYINNYSPVGGSQSTHFTEATESGYAAEAMTGSTWTISTTGTGIAEASATQRTFSFTTAATVYGYYVTSTGTTYLYWAEEFTDGPYTVPSGGGDISVTPAYDLKSSTS